MERKQVDTELRPVELQPQARPVDTFVQPAQSGWRDVADALSKIDRPLAQFMDARAKKQAEDDMVRGQAAYLNGSAGDLATLIQQGKVPAQYSPAFVRGWQLASGDVLGNNLGARFAADYDAWDGKNSTDPTAYEKFTQDWLSKNVPKDADPMVLRGLLPKLRSSVAGMGAQHIQDVHNHVYNGAVDAGVAGANQDVDEFTKEGLAVPEGTNYPKLFEAIQSRRQQMIDQGVRPEDFDKQMMQAMSAKVLSTRDPGLLKWFDEKVPGKDYTYGDTPDGQKIKGETIESLDVINRSNLSEEREQQTARDKETLRSAKAAAVDILLKDPRAAIPDSILAAGTSVDGDFKVNVEQWRQNLSKGLPSDPARVNHVYNAMRVAASQGGDPMTVFYDAMANAVFANKEDMAAGLSFAKALTDSKDNIKAAFEDQSYKRMAQTLDIRTKGVNPLTGDPIVGTSNEGLEALYDFQQKVSDWVMQNPQATSVDRAKAISDIGNDILKNLAAPTDALDTGEGAQGQQYNRPDNLGFDNPFSKGTATQQDIPVQGSTPAGKAITGTINKALEDAKARAAAGAPDPNEVQDFLGGLTPEQKTQMEGRAKAFGLSLEDFATKMLTKPPAATDGDKRSDAGDAFKPVSFETTGSVQGGDEGTNNAGNPVMTAEVATRLLDESLTDATGVPEQGGGKAVARVPVDPSIDPQASRLIGLILQHEAGGNWNAVFGNARNKVNLGKYTLNQILAMQVAARARGAKSTAIGGPQFIYKTLRSLKQDMGLTGSEKFTPQLQAQMAMVLLRRRGWDAYKAGRLSKRAFALHLAQEWASLPDPNTGRSVYAGDGLNAASARPREVYAALGLPV